jgi:DNA-binding transcriptional regulator YhcF (GntR family)
MIVQARNTLASEQIELFLKKMAGIGFTREETLALLEKKIKE